MKTTRIFLLKVFIFFVVKFSIYLNRCVFVMRSSRNYKYMFRPHRDPLPPLWNITMKHISKPLRWNKTRRFEVRTQEKHKQDHDGPEHRHWNQVWVGVWVGANFFPFFVDPTWKGIKQSYPMNMYPFPLLWNKISKLDQHIKMSLLVVAVVYRDEVCNIFRIDTSSKCSFILTIISLRSKGPFWEFGNRVQLNPVLPHHENTPI